MSVTASCCSGDMLPPVCVFFNMNLTGGQNIRIAPLMRRLYEILAVELTCSHTDRYLKLLWHKISLVNSP